MFFNDDISNVRVHFDEQYSRTTTFMATLLIACVFLRNDAAVTTFSNAKHHLRSVKREIAESSLWAFLLEQIGN